MNGDILDASHLEQLKNSAISDDVIIERGYKTIADKSELVSMGFSPAQQHVPGLLIPQWGVDGNLTNSQYRPDTPRVNAKGKVIKYENPTGSGIRLDCPPRCQKMLGDPTVPLWITEGSKKADALATHGTCALSLTGVWGFKGKNQFGAVTMLSDWDYVALKDRLVYLAFDSDVLEKPEVKKALTRLAEHLEKKQASVKIVRLQGGAGGKVGVDDYLAGGHSLDDLQVITEPYEADLEAQEIRRPFFFCNNRLYLQIKKADFGTSFCYIENGKAKFTDQLSIGKGRVVVPQELPRGEDGVQIDLVGMPDEGVGAVSLLTPDQLFGFLKSHISRYVDLAAMDLELCCYYALFTWFYCKVNTVGYLRFISDTGKGKTRAQRVVSDLCFYPFRTSGASSFSGMARTSQRWRGTMVTDEADIDGDMANQIVKFLNLGFERGQYYVLSDKQNPREQQYFDPFMPRVLAMRKPFQDNATEGRLLSITTYETGNLDIPVILPPAYYAAAQTLRNSIARFVMEHWNEVDGNRMSDFRGLAIEPRLKQLAMPLSIIFQVWPDGLDHFKSYLLQRQNDLRRERSMSWEGMLFNMVLSIASGELDLKDAFPGFYQDDEVQAITPSMVASQVKSKPKAVTQGLTSIGFVIESRRLANGKKPRLYALPDARKWRETVSRYYYSEDQDTATDAPEVLRSSKYVVSSEASQVSQPSPEEDESHEPCSDGTLGTVGTVSSRRNTQQDNAEAISHRSPGDSVYEVEL